MLLILPYWLTSEKYLTLATWGLVGATVILGVATLLLYLDGRTKSKEQRDRWANEDLVRQREHSELLEKWRRDDEIRIQGMEPRFVWGFDHSWVASRLDVWVANLGSNSFLLTTIWVERQDPMDRKPIDPRPIHFVPAEIVDTGTRKTFGVLKDVPFPRELQFGGDNSATVRYEVWCTVESPLGQIQTPRKAIVVTLHPKSGLISSSEEMIQKLNPSL